MRTFKLKIPTSASAIRFLGAELKQTADETLLLELALRGIALSGYKKTPKTTGRNRQNLIKSTQSI